MMLFWKQNRWDAIGGFDQTGMEWKEADELVRALDDTVKSQFYMAV
jgi:hypothetical protein